MILLQLLEFVKGHEWNNKKRYPTPFAYKSCDEKYYVKQAFVCKKKKLTLSPITLAINTLQDTHE